MGQQPVGPDHAEVADEHGDGLAEPAGVASVAGGGVLFGERDVRGGPAAAGGGRVHHVVVHQGEGVQQLQRGQRGQHGRQRRGAADGPAPAPVGERGADPLAAGQDGVPRGGGEAAHRRVDVVEGVDLGGEEGVQGLVDRRDQIVGVSSQNGADRIVPVPRPGRRHAGHVARNCVVGHAAERTLGYELRRLVRRLNGGGPVETDLTAAYDRCRELHKRHGRTYYLATRLLPAWKRRHVHALYGFTRYADEIVDRTEDLPPAERAALLDRLGRPVRGRSARRAGRRPTAAGRAAHDRRLRSRPGRLRVVSEAAWRWT